MLLDEKILTFAEAAKTLPKIGGRRPHAPSVWRWARKGIGGVKLECRRVGARFCTTAEALERFSKTLSEIEPAPRPLPLQNPSIPIRTPATRQREIARAEATLAAAGI